MRPYYDQDGITIYHGDCLEVFTILDPVDFILTDPPYGIHKAEWDKKFDFPWDECGRLAPLIAVMPGILNLPECPRYFFKHEFKWCLAAHLINGMTRGCIGFGNWIPLLIWASDSISVYRPDGDCRDFVVGLNKKPNHPSPKPLNVIKWFISRFQGETILDPFMGSGTTLVAAKQLGRRAIGIEIEERYCEVAVKRLAQGALFGPENQP